MVDGVYTTGDVARLCGVAPRTVSRWIDSGLLDGYVHPGGNDRRVKPAVLAAFMAKHGMPTPEEILANYQRLVRGWRGDVRPS